MVASQRTVDETKDVAYPHSPRSGGTQQPVPQAHGKSGRQQRCRFSNGLEKSSPGRLKGWEVPTAREKSGRIVKKKCK
jgi:hypothetical protein